MNLKTNNLNLFLQISLCSLLVCLTLCYGQVGVPLSVVRVLDLEKSVFYAERNRKEVILAEQTINLAEERIGEARSYKFPKIDLLWNYSHFDPNNLPIVLPPSFGSMYLPREEEEEKKVRDYYYLGRFSLWWDLYAGGRYKRSLVVADSNLSTAENQLEMVKNDINFETKKAFYTLLTAEEKLKIYDPVLSDMQKIIPPRSQQRKPDIDQLHIQETVFQIESEHRLIKNNYSQYQLDFLNTLGLELNTIFSIEGKLEPIIREYKVNELLALAFQYRAEPKQVLIQEKIDDLALKLSLIARHPTVTLGAHYEFGNDDPSHILKEKGWITALNVDIPLFEGLVFWSRIRQKRLQITQRKLKRREIEDAIRLEVRKAHKDYIFWLEELNKKESEVKKYKDILESVPKKDGLLLINTHKLYLRSRLDYLDTICQNITSHAQLEHAVGKTLISE